MSRALVILTIVLFSAGACRSGAEGRADSAMAARSAQSPGGPPITTGAAGTTGTAESAGAGGSAAARVSAGAPGRASTATRTTTAHGGQRMSFTLTSSAFTEGGAIPPKYTCEGDDVSPPLAWSGAPDGTRTFALIVDDPDAPDPAAPKMTYVHWVAYDIPSSVSSLDENASKNGMPAGAKQGLNDWKKAQYGGPCPPIGRHRYFFKLYALDTNLATLSNPTKPDLETAMKGHVLAQTQVMGTYQKSKK